MQPSTTKYELTGRRILRIVTLASRSGAYGGPFDTASRQILIAAELEASAVLLAGSFPEDRPDLVTDLVERSYVNVRRWLPIEGFAGIYSLRLLRDTIRRVRKAEIVHISLSRELVPLISLVVARLARRPTLLQPHGMLTSRTSFLHKVINIPLRLAVGRSTMIALTALERAALVEIFPRHGTIEILGNPTPSNIEHADFPRSLTSTNSEVIFIARLHPRKRVIDFVGAATVAQARNWPERYTVVGPDGGDLRQILRSSAVTYEGAISADEVSVRLDRAQVFVLSSQDEPWGNVLVAALAMGIPCVVTSSAALSTMIATHGAGRVVPDQDPNAIADAVHSILETASTYAEASLGAVRLAQANLSPANQKLELGRIYADVLHVHSIRTRTEGETLDG